MPKSIEYKMNEDAVQTLCKNDPILGKLINAVGDYTLTVQEPNYEALVKKIVGQQLSVKAASTIWSRVAMLCPIVEPGKIQTIDDEALRSVGVSRPKIKYIRDLTEKTLNGELDLSNIHLLEDEEVVRTLTMVKGIGQWSAEMFLIFSLGRENIFSYGDVGLRRGMKWLYQIEDKEIDTFATIDTWAPYKSIASLYLWEVVNQNFILDYKNIDELLVYKNNEKS